MQSNFETRRGQIETYFDRTALQAWEQLTSTAPVGRIRATVRAGRDRMRATLLDWLPQDLRGLRSGDELAGSLGEELGRGEVLLRRLPAQQGSPWLSCAR